MLDTLTATAFAHYTQFSRQGWQLAFTLVCTSVHAVALLSILLFSAFFLVFVVREVVAVSLQLLRHCAHVGAILLNVRNHRHQQHARVGDTAVASWTKVLSSCDLASLQ